MRARRMVTTGAKCTSGELLQLPAVTLTARFQLTALQVGSDAALDPERFHPFGGARLLLKFWGSGNPPNPPPSGGGAVVRAELPQNYHFCEQTHRPALLISRHAWARTDVGR
jgi:hypothetical protein